MSFKISTPVGMVEKSLFDDLVEVAGLRWNGETKSWAFLEDKCEFWKLNKNSERRSNEAKWYKKEGWLPLRYNNFMYALYKVGGFDIKQAIEYAKRELFGVVGEPVYLPDVLNVAKGLPVDVKNYTYGQILREMDQGLIRRN